MSTELHPEDAAVPVATADDVRSRLAALTPEKRRALERLLRGRRAGPAAVPRTDRRQDLPLTYGQLGLWLAEQAAPGSPAYHMPGVLELRGDAAVLELAAALTAVAARHEALRTRFVLAAGTPVQRIAPPAPVPLPVCDLRALPGACRDAAAQRLARRLSVQPFDLAAGPPIRAALLHLEPLRRRLVLTVHHLVADRWSMAVVLRDLAACYRRRRDPGKAPEPPAPPATGWADFAAWQRRRVDAGELDDEVEHWRRVLAAAPAVLELPADRARPSLPSGRAGRHAASLADAAAVRRMARDGRTTPFVVLLAAFAAFLGRLAGQRRVIVGTPVAGRQRPDTRDLVGYLVNAVPLLVELGGAADLRSLVARTREAATAAFSHQEVPFHRMVEELRPRREPARHPLFQVMLSYQDVAVEATGFGDLDAELLPVDTGSAQLDLTLVAREGAGGELTADWEYSSDLFTAGRVRELADAFAAFLAAGLEEPRRPLHRLPLAAPGQRRRLIETWNPERRTTPPADGPVVVHQLVEAAVRRAPGAVAVELAEERLTYAELEAEANRIARALTERGAGPEVRVGLCTGRSPRMVAGLLGVLKSGSAVVPLDPAYPAERLAHVIEDAALALVVCDGAGEAALPTGGPPRLRLGEAAGRAAGDPGPPPVPRLAASLAYVIYTSGSTGRPKGVAVAHGPAVEHFAAWARRFELGPEDRVYQFASLSFDAGLEQLLPSLAAGARVVLRGDEPPTPEALALQAAQQGLTVLYLPAAYWQAMTQVWASGEAAAGALRLVNPGGDVMAVEAVRRYARSPLAGVPLLNGYGPTEAVVTTAACEVPVGAWRHAASPARVPIGAPVHGRTVYVLDRDGELLTPGVAGELHVGGRYLARGYLGAAARTAAAFVPDPFGERPGARLYRTGDRVAHLPDGRLDFLGRVDHQVKVRGFRVELGEVEAALEELAAVERAVVTAPEEGPGRRRLVAYVVPAPGAATAQLELAALRAALAGRLPDHMLPAVRLVLDELPLNANGKVDRRALPAPSVPQGVGEHEPPSNRREELLASLWCEVLGLERVGVRDNFFTLGGDSILSLRIIARAHAAGLHLTPGQFFRYPTVAELAAAAGAAACPPAVSRPASGDVPPTPIQRWFFAHGFAHPWHWNQGQAFVLERPVELAWLRRAAAVLLAHHDGLRSRFRHDADGWRQVIAPSGELGDASAVAVTAVDLCALPAARRAAAGTAVAAAMQSSLDLTAGPLARFGLLLGGAEQRLLLVFHHLLIDGVSWGIVLEDLARALAAAAAGETPRLPPRTTSLAAWGEELAALAASGRFRGQLDHWLTAAGAEPVATTGEAARARRHVVELGEDATRRLLQEAPRAYHTRVDELLLTGLVQAFAEVRGEARLCVELEGHGREEVVAGVDLTRTVGWLTAKYPVSFDLTGLADPGDPAAAIPAVKETLRAVPDRGFGYGVLRYLDGGSAGRALAAAAPPPLTFNYLGRLDAPAGLAWPLRPLFAAAGPEVGRGNRLANRLEVVALVLDGRLRLIWNHDPALDASTEVDALAACCRRCLEALAEHCAGLDEPRFTPSDFPLAGLDAAALDRLLAAVPALEDAYPLSPVQEGMLFHSLSAPGSGVYVEQLVLELTGDLDRAAFAAAWTRVVERHAVLRTAFVWEGLRRPLQAVARRVEILWQELDWRDSTAAERERRLTALLEADRRRGFDLHRAPLMRFYLLREDAGRYRFAWCNHHLLVDGWTEPMVLEEVFSAYTALRAGEEPRWLPRRPYRDYVEWLEQADEVTAERFWRGALAGLDGPTRLPADPAADPAAEGHAEEELLLGEAESRRLAELCRAGGLTVNSVVQGAWLLLLGVYTGRHDVVAGITVSGRPAELPGVAEMIGMFINTLPLRARLEPTRRLIDWLRRLQEHTGELLQFESTPLVCAQGWSGLGHGVPLFDTIVVCMSLPRDEEALRRPAPGLRIDGARGIEQTHYPLTVTARPGARLLLQINHQLAFVGRARARAVAGHLEGLLTALTERPGLTVGEVAGIVEESDRRLRQRTVERSRSQRREAFGKVRRRAGRRRSGNGELQEVNR